MAGRIGRLFLLALSLSLTTGCAGLITSAASGLADNLASAIEDQEDPELVREAIPSYLLLLDSVARSASDDPDILGAAAELYAVYGVAFVGDGERAKTLTLRARDYGSAALCSADRDACDLTSLPFDDYAATIRGLKPGAVDALYSYSLSYLAYIQANADDYNALAALPKVEVALQHLVELGSGDKEGAVNMYLGVLNTLRPPALGGKPEQGRAYFERAVELTGGRDLAVKVEFARGYARLVYDRELHDKLLNEVLASEVKQPGLTLVNSLARRQAEELLASADDYF